ncbi:MAG: flagellar biosynthetic protein FliO [Rubrivivax sp.]|jgi:flagellar protein FliO/FliZ|nr:flagellar biosynthetic protein FliO [Rubrivivax sp.]
MNPGWSALLWFGAVVAAIPLVLWLLKRTPIGGAAAGAGLRSIAVLPLSTTQRIVTVEVGHGDDRRWLVLGVSPGNIQTLHLMDAQSPPGPALPPPAPPVAFAQLLQRLRGTAQGPRAS